MGNKKRQKKLDWWIENFGERDGKKHYISFLAASRKQRIAILKTIGNVATLGTLFRTK